MSDRPPTSVLLPTTRWTDACAELAAQLGDSDELLLIHDREDDPIAGWEDHPEGVRIVDAGEPEGCSGKANAIVAGMEAARHDRLVWTDDDFHHPPDWLATFSADYADHGPVSEVPYFVGQDSLSVVLEPLYASAGSLGLYLGNQIWGGAVMFERDDIDEAAFLDDLRRTISDDGLLMEYLQVTTVGRTRIVPIGGGDHPRGDRAPSPMDADSPVAFPRYRRRDKSRLVTRPYRCGPDPALYGGSPDGAAPRSQRGARRPPVDGHAGLSGGIRVRAPHFVRACPPNVRLERSAIPLAREVRRDGCRVATRTRATHFPSPRAVSPPAGTFLS